MGTYEPLLVADSTERARSAAEGAIQGQPCEVPGVGAAPAGLRITLSAGTPAWVGDVDRLVDLAGLRRRRERVAAIDRHAVTALHVLVDAAIGNAIARVKTLL